MNDTVLSKMNFVVPKSIEIISLLAEVQDFQDFIEEKYFGITLASRITNDKYRETCYRVQLFFIGKNEDLLGDVVEIVEKIMKVIPWCVVYVYQNSNGKTELSCVYEHQENEMWS